MIEFLKGVAVGIGGVAPGLSGSVLLVIFGLYRRVVDAVGTLLRDLRGNLAFLVPIGAGIVVGVLLFSKVVDFLLADLELPTRYAFLGLIVGTVPLFFREVRANGYGARYRLVSAAALVAGALVVYGPGAAASVTDPDPVQSVVMGVVYAGSAIIPGVDSAAIMSAFGLYVPWVAALADLDFAVLVPAAAGLGAGLLAFSFVMHRLLARCYTLTYAVIFGLFLSVIPSVLRAETGAFIVPAEPGEAALAAACAVVGFACAFYLGDIQGNNERIRKALGRG